MTTATASLALSAIEVVFSVVMLLLGFGRGRGPRTPNLRFWRPTLCQLSYAPGFLFDDLCDDTGADRLAALADGKAKPLLHRDRRDQRHHHLYVVPRHHHLRALGQLDRPRHVGRAEVKLRPVVVEERRVPPAFLLREHVHLALELLVRGDRTGLREHLPALDLFALGAPKQDAHVVARLAFVEELPEHLHARAHRLLRRLDADDLDLVAHVDDAPFDPARDHRPAPRD